MLSIISPTFNINIETSFIDDVMHICIRNKKKKEAW